MKKKPLAHYLDLMKSALDKQEWINAKRYGEIALNKLPKLSYSPFNEYILHTRLGYAYSELAEYSRSLDSLYKADLIASKNHLVPAYIAYVSFVIGYNFLYIRSMDQALLQFQKVKEYYQKYGYDIFPMDKKIYLGTLICLGRCYLYKNQLGQVQEVIENEDILHQSLMPNKWLVFSNYYHLKGEYLMATKEYNQARQSFQESIDIITQFNLRQSHVFEIKIHLATIDLLECRLESAIQILQNIMKSSQQLRINNLFCEAGLLLSKSYTLKKMPDKTATIEKRIKPMLNKLDINWLYEKTREFEQLYHKLQPIYQNSQNGTKSVPIVLTNILNQRYEISVDKDGIIIGKSIPMIEIYHLIDKIAPTDLPVLIQGETGTGKELVAQAIYQNSLRKETVWLALNCGTIPETLLENTLFGQVKGAFTDAKRDKKGYIETASGGTLLLDEIGDMLPSMQQKMLRVLEEKQIWPVGAEKPIPVDTRFIFASNQNIEELVKKTSAGSVQEKRFREDLFYRINTIVITLPPLRDRKEDIPLLVQHFLAKYSVSSKSEIRNQKSEIEIAPDALALLQGYHWPGNVRELENEIKRIYTLHPDATIITDLMLSDIIRNYQHSIIPTQSSLKELKSLAEKNIIVEYLKKHNGNIAQAGRELGYLRPNLSRKIKQLGISVKDYITKK
jgi:transcriptional regulator with PAS, ATPase and Fis domain